MTSSAATIIACRAHEEYRANSPPQTLKASKALLAHIKKASAEKEAAAEKKTLLGDDDEVPVWLQMTTKRHIADSSRLKPGRIYLPHSMNTNEHLSICLIAADNTKDLIKAALESDDFPKTIKVEKIIEYTSLSKKYTQYEAQRKLFAEYDIFLGDDRVINRLPKGKSPSPLPGPAAHPSNRPLTAPQSSARPSTSPPRSAPSPSPSSPGPRRPRPPPARSRTSPRPPRISPPTSTSPPRSRRPSTRPTST